MYKNLTEDQILERRKNVDAFYSDPDLQRKWQSVLLHPNCLIFRRDGSLEPISLVDLDPEIIKRYMQTTIQIGKRKHINGFLVIDVNMNWPIHGNCMQGKVSIRAKRGLA